MLDAQFQSRHFAGEKRLKNSGVDINKTLKRVEVAMPQWPRDRALACHFVLNDGHHADMATDGWF